MTNAEIEKRIAVLETSLCRDIKYLRELIDKEFKASDKALIIATNKLAHELDLLNHRYEDLERKVADLKEYKDISVGKHLMLSAVVAIAVSLIVIYFGG